MMQSIALMLVFHLEIRVMGRFALNGTTNIMKHLALMAVCGGWVAFANANPLKQAPNERAYREADGPMRVIIEAAKVKRGVKPVGPEPVTAPGTRPKPATAANSATASPVTVISAPSKAASKSVPKESNRSDVERPSWPQTPMEEAASSATSTAASSPTPSRAESPAPTSDAERQAPAIRLLYKVDPVLPEKLQSQIQQDTEVTVRLGIDPQGFVYRVEVLSKVLPGLDSLIQSALRRWRFEPMKDRATATVVLVFRADE
jgi:outer membrane biosynthesis protein TonB